MESAGARLRKVRLEKGISLEDAQRHTKIHLNILKALEEDSLVNVSPVYIKGFLKIYCQFLGVEPRDYISDYKEPQAIYHRDTAGIQEKLPSLGRKFPISFDFLQKLNLKLIRKIVIIVVLFAALALGLFKFGKFISQRRRQALPQRVARIKNQAPAQNENREVVSSSLPVASGIRFVIQAREDCWVSLKVDGHVVFQRILKKGRLESWQAKERINLSLGNAAVVTLEVNGKTFSNLGRKGQSLKNIVITREGITIGR